MKKMSLAPVIAMHVSYRTFIALGCKVILSASRSPPGLHSARSRAEAMEGHPALNNASSLVPDFDVGGGQKQPQNYDFDQFWHPWAPNLAPFWLP